ncbi:MAG: 50S ribosomal protein L18e [Candidatus Aenigmarchaeota archaeon]|nr:50S ribosomal protein L18e [Candidatus Aenigmarchaeota archaeon]
MQLRDKHQGTKSLLVALERTKQPLWLAVAREVNRPRRRQRDVNILDIDRCSQNGETLAVPAKVLGTGETAKKVTVAALGFSPAARQKIEQAGGKALSLLELVRQHPEGKGVRILG